MTLLLLVFAALALHFVRQWWAHRVLPAHATIEFDGTLHRAAETNIAVKRPAGGATRTLICVPGFLENSRYYLDLYDGASRDSGAADELILINNANYHCPFDETHVEPLDWEPNPHRVGTIAHDAFFLARAIETLATTDQIVLHGHSRGGAVVLDAGRQFPALMRDGGRRISAVLEAPVVPRGTPTGGAPGPVQAAITHYMLPLAFSLLRNMRERRLRKLPMMQPTNDVKTALMKTLFEHPRDYATCVVNVSDIGQWQRQQPYALYQNFEQITVLVGERDDVLSTRTMTASAEHGAKLNQGLAIVQTTGTNHFISLEKPGVVQQALRDAAARRDQPGAAAP